MYKLFLSVRYFRSRLINVIPVLCMMLGVAALIVILAVMDGFQAQLRATLRGTLSHLIVRVNYESDFARWEKILLNVDGVEAVSPHLQSFALVADVGADVAPGRAPASVRMQGAGILGIDPEREGQVSEFTRYLLYRERGPTARPPGEWESSTPDPSRPFEILNPRWDRKRGVILGYRLAQDLGIERPWKISGEDEEPMYGYDRVFLTTMVRGDGEGETTYEARQEDFCVTGLYESGNHEIDRYIAFLDREDAREFFELARDPQEIRIRLADYEKQKMPVMRELYDRQQEIFAATAVERESWSGYGLPYTVRTWEDVRRNFLNAIDNEKGLIAIIAGMAFIVTGFMIFSILSMIVTMKTKDIGILKALGGTTRGVLQIFLVNGLLVGLIGSSLGLGLGLLFTHHINAVKEFLNQMFGWQPFPPTIYLFSEIPTSVMPGEVATVTIVALFVALLGAVLPALRAARMDPVESLRYE